MPGLIDRNSDGAQIYFVCSKQQVVTFIQRLRSLIGLV